MDWLLAIERNRAALLAVVAAVASLVGGDGPVARGLRRAALALLRPAEAAARRLIVVAARGLAVRLRSVRPWPGGLALAGRAGGRAPAFRLFDPPKLYAPALVIVPPPRGTPRIRTFWTSPTAQPLVAPPPAPAASLPAPPARPDWQAPVEAARLRLRLAALSAALADLPRQARRLARVRAKLEARAANGPRPRQPLRLGRPPGWRQRPDREVDTVLRECHALAREAQRADTS